MDLSVMQLVIGVAAVVALGFAAWGLWRWRYVSSFRSRGWRFVDRPSMDVAVGLNHAPFGAGFGREVDDLVEGEASNGTPFQAFEYDYDDWRSAHYVVRFPLPAPMPFLYVTALDGATGIPGLPQGWVGEAGNKALLAADERYGREMGDFVAARIGGLTGYELSIDHANLVVFDVPGNASVLADVVEAGSSLAAAIGPRAHEFEAAPAPQTLSFNHRPDWRYVARDSSYLELIRHDDGGFDHRASDIVMGTRDGISFLRLRHDWKTQSRDSEGRSTTHHHVEYLCEFRCTFPFAPLDLGTSMLGIRNDRAGIQLESAAFNRAYLVRAASSKFAHDVLHPRMMQWLLDQGAPKFEIRPDGGIVLEGYGDWELDAITHADALLHAFFARVPDFVYQNLGAWPRPVPGQDC